LALGTHVAATDESQGLIDRGQIEQLRVELPGDPL
jgi:hypothetical protein